MSPPDEGSKSPGEQARALVTVPPAVAERASSKELVEMLATLAAPWAKADEAKAAGETRRSEIQAGTQKFNSALVLVFVIAVLALATIALLKGKDGLTEKIVIGLLGFAGGYGFGKGVQKVDRG